MKEYIIAPIILVFLLAIAVVCLSNAMPANRIEFRLVLSSSELEGKHWEEVSIDGKDIRAWKIPYLTENDIERVHAVSSVSSPGTLYMSIEFSESGRRKLYRFTKRFAHRRVVIFADGKPLVYTKIEIPVFTSSVVVIIWPWEGKALRDFVRKVNKEIDDRRAQYCEEQEVLNAMMKAKFQKVLSHINGYLNGSGKDAKTREDPLLSID